MQLAPIVRLAAQPAEIELPAGPLLTNVQLSQQVCAQGLKFIAPVFAEVTRTEGQFSVALPGGGFRWPIRSRATWPAASKFNRSKCGRDPSCKRWSALRSRWKASCRAKCRSPITSQAVALVRMENQKVDFRLVDRRMYHRGLQFVAGNVTITTRGSVGLDESLAVLAEIPLTPNLVGSTRTPPTSTGKRCRFRSAEQSRIRRSTPAIEQLPLLLIKGTGQVLNRLEGTLEKLVPGQRDAVRA